MSDDRFTKLATLALDVAVEAPTKRNRTTSEARIPWGLVIAIRAELERLGIDWREVQRRTREEAEA